MRRRQRRRIRKWLAGLDYDVDERETRRIWHAWVRRTLKIRIMTFVLFLLPVSAFWIWLNFNMLRVGGGITRVFITILIYISIPIMVFVLAHRGLVAVLGRRQFYEVVRERGFDICSHCGHRLTGIHANGENRGADETMRCPECGFAVNEMRPLGARDAATS